MSLPERLSRLQVVVGTEPEMDCAAPLQGGSLTSAAPSPCGKTKKGLPEIPASERSQNS